MTNNIVNVCPSCGQELDTENVFSVSDIKQMDLEEYIQNRTKILRQLEQGKIIKGD